MPLVQSIAAQICSGAVAGSGNHILHYSLKGNEIWRYLILLAVISATLVAGRLVRYFIERSAARLGAIEKAVLVKLFLLCLSRPALVAVYALGISISRAFMKFQPEEKVAEGPGFSRDVYNLWGQIGMAFFAIAVAYFVYRLVDIVEYYLRRWTSQGEGHMNDMLVPLIRKTLRVFIIVISALFIADAVLKWEITSVLAAAGVGGLAIALAAQETIANFFGSINIFADRPFQVKDRIRVGSCDGTVEEVGFRSTRIRTLDGHLVTIPNSSISKDMVEDISARPYIKRLANITITYDTPPEKVERAVQIIKEILSQTEEVNRDPELAPKVVFDDFKDWALNILVVYWVKPPDYGLFLEVSQRINMSILRQFNAEGIEFAFPTQTLYIHKPEAKEGDFQY